MRQERQMRERKTKAGAAARLISETGQTGECLRHQRDTGRLPFRLGSIRNRWNSPDSFVPPLELPEAVRRGTEKSKKETSSIMAHASPPIICKGAEFTTSKSQELAIKSGGLYLLIPL